MSVHKIIAFFLLIFPLLVKADKVNEIEITGNNVISRGTILNSLPFEVGDDFDDVMLKKSIELLYSSGLYKDISVNFANNIFKVEILENPTIKYIEVKEYSDGDVLSSENLEKLISNFNLKNGQIFTELNFNNFKETIKDLYLDNGYFKLDLVEKIDIDSLNRIGIEIVVNENNPAKIESFNILGSNYFSSEELIDIFEIGEPDFFVINFFTHKDAFSDFLYLKGLEEIRNKYLSEGFLDFKFLRKEKTISDNKEEINIEIEIYEGKRYLVDNIILKGNSLNLTYENFIEIIDIKKNDFFDRKKLVSNLQILDKEFSDNGYADIKINSDVKISGESTLDIIVDIEPNEKFYIRRINISGNNITQDDVIRREFRVNEGQAYSKTDIEDSIKQIKKLGYFSDVKFNISDVDQQKDFKDIFIEVVESKTGTISFGLSHSNSAGSSFNAGIQQRNIFGTGNTFNGVLSNSEAVKEISFFFSDPYFNDKKQTVRYGAFSKSTDAEYLDISSYTLDEKGFTSGYEAPISSDLFLGIDFKYSNLNLLCGSLLASVGYEESECKNPGSLDTNISIHSSLNTLNDFYFPTEGTSFYNNFTLGLPPGDFKYYTINSSYNDYTPIGNDLTLKLSAKFDLGSGYANDNLPFFKRFYAGGASSVRGFDFNSIGDKYPNGSVKGGELSYLSNATIISPVPFINDSGKMRLGAFVDFGGLSNKLSTFSIDESRASSGLAFSWLTPIGPLGVYMAQPLMKKNSDQIQNFTFNLGTTF